MSYNATTFEFEDGEEYELHILVLAFAFWVFAISSTALSYASLYPVRRRALETLLKTTPTPEKGQECPLCLEDFEPPATASRLPCGHAFHEHCITTWLITFHGDTCPVCRVSVPLPSDGTEEALRSGRRMLMV